MNCEIIAVRRPVSGDRCSHCECEIRGRAEKTVELREDGRIKMVCLSCVRGRYKLGLGMAVRKVPAVPQTGQIRWEV